MGIETETSHSSPDTDSQLPDNDAEELYVSETDLETADDSHHLSDDNFYTSPTVEYVPPHAFGNLLGFFSPGTFLTLGANPHYGIILNMGLALLSFVLCLLCIFCNLYPIPMFIFVMVLIISVWLYGIARTIKSPPRMTTMMPWAQAGIAFLTFWLPFVACFFLETNFMLQRTWMSNDNMNPGIIQGDVILVDRLAFQFSAPTYGDLVLIAEMPNDESSRRRAFFGRIIACGGDEIQLQGVHPVVNGTRLSHYIHREDNSYEMYERTIFEIPYNVAETDTMLEPSGWYPVRMPQDLLFSQTNSVKLEPDYYYVLEDNRTSGIGHVRSSYGFIVHRSEIQGRPKYVIYNTKMKDHLSRYGLAIR